MSLARVGAAAEIVTLDLAKLHCSVDGSEQDVLITGFVEAATEAVAQGVGMALGPETWLFKCGPAFGPVALPVSPATALVSISYLDVDLVVQTADLADFDLFVDEPISWVQPKPGKSWPRSAPRPDAIWISFSAGPVAPLPALRVAVLLLVGHWFANREAVSAAGAPLELPASVQSLINLHRIGWIKA